MAGSAAVGALVGCMSWLMEGKEFGSFYPMPKKCNQGLLGGFSRQVLVSIRKKRTHAKADACAHLRVGSLYATSTLREV